MSISEVIIHMHSDSGAAEMTVRRGVMETVKTVDLNMLIDIFCNSLNTGIVNSGVLPQGCLHIAQGANYRDVVLCYGGLHADVTYKRTLYPNFPLPRLVFDFKVNDDGVIAQKRIGVMKDEVPRAETPMYLYPFSNILSNSAICMGNNSLPKITELRTLTTLPPYIIGLPNSDDSFSRSSNALRMGYAELMEHLKDKEPSYYYEKVLVTNGFTLQDFIDRRF